MKTENNEVEKLKDFASKTNREININTEDNILKIIIPVNSKETSFYISYENKIAFDDNAIFRGVFFPIFINKNIEILIREKNKLEQLTPFLGQTSSRSRFKHFDSQVTIEETDREETNKIFSNSELQNLVIKTFKTNSDLKIGVNKMPVSYNIEMENQSYFGIYINQKGGLDTVLIEELFKLAEKFQAVIK